MAQATPKKSNKTNIKLPRHAFEYADFSRWIALPKSLRTPQTQRELAQEFGVGEDTLSEWKTREGFWEEVANHRRAWGKERTPEVLQALFVRATNTGDPRACELWLEITEQHGKPGSIVCTHCQKYAQYEALTDAELRALIKKQEDFFAKR